MSYLREGGCPFTFLAFAHLANICRVLPLCQTLSLVLVTVLPQAALIPAFRQLTFQWETQTCSTSPTKKKKSNECHMEHVSVVSARENTAEKGEAVPCGLLHDSD